MKTTKVSDRLGNASNKLVEVIKSLAGKGKEQWSQNKAHKSTQDTTYTRTSIHQQPSKKGFNVQSGWIRNKYVLGGIGVLVGIIIISPIFIGGATSGDLYSGHRFKEDKQGSYVVGYDSLLFNQRIESGMPILELDEQAYEDNLSRYTDWQKETIDTAVTLDKTDREQQVFVDTIKDYMDERTIQSNSLIFLQLGLADEGFETDDLDEHYVDSLYQVELINQEMQEYMEDYIK